MKKPLALTLIAALALSACATRPPAPGTPMGHIAGSLGYAPEGKVLKQARIKLCKPDGEVASEFSYLPFKSGGSIAFGALTEPGFAGETFVETLPAGEYHFCGSEFSERPANPSALAPAGDAVLDGLLVVVVVVAATGLITMAVLSGGFNEPVRKTRKDLLPVTVTIEAGKVSYIGRYRGFQQPAAKGAEAVSGWVVLDKQEDDLAKLPSKLAGLPVLKALPSADLPAKVP